MQNKAKDLEIIFRGYLCRSITIGFVIMKSTGGFSLRRVSRHAGGDVTYININIMFNWLLQLLASVRFWPPNRTTQHLTIFPPSLPLSRPRCSSFSPKPTLHQAAPSNPTLSYSSAAPLAPAHRI